jgi:tetratricopeptide (TPR) repeat protein
VPRDLVVPQSIAESDAARVVLLYLSHVNIGVPLSLLAIMLGLDDDALQRALATLLRRGLILVKGDTIELAPHCPRVTAVNRDKLLDRLLRNGLAALDRREPCALLEGSIRALAETCTRCTLVSPERVATAFRFLDKALKNLGDVVLVRATAEACVRAARSLSGPDATEEIRRGEAQALICGVAWAKQRTGHLHEARADGELSLEIGQALRWERNTAFCHKCLGRLLRLEGSASNDASQRQLLLRQSEALLLQSINDFGALSELSAAQRAAEVAACYSLLGRTLMELDRCDDARLAIEEATRRMPDVPGKDLADLWILRGEFNIRWGDEDKARVAFTCAIEAAETAGYEVTEMRARAFEQRARVTLRPADDLAKAASLFRHLNDDEAAARVEVERLRVLGRVPHEFIEPLSHQSHVVALKTVRLFHQRATNRPRALAYREAIPATAVEELIDSARRSAVIEHGEAARVMPPMAAGRSAKRSRGSRTVLEIAAALVPGARSTHAAARALANRMAGTVRFPPVDIDALAIQFGVKEIRGARLLSTGELHGEPGNFVVLYSTQVSKQRARFTIAHELAHALLLSLGWSIRDGQERELEAFCDDFASMWLVPERFLAPELPLPLTVATAGQLARRFDVSLSVAVRRLCRHYRSFEVFCVRRGDVAWSAGTISRGAVTAMPVDLQRLVAECLVTGQCSADVYAATELHTGRWSVDSLGGPGDDAIFILSPTHRAGGRA